MGDGRTAGEPALDLLKVSAWSNPKAVAGAIAGVLRERGEVDVQVIGAAALNQAVKAIAIARSYVAADGLDPVCTPGFQDIEIAGEGRTAIRIHVEDRTGQRGVARSGTIPSKAERGAPRHAAPEAAPEAAPDADPPS